MIEMENCAPFTVNITLKSLDDANEEELFVLVIPFEGYPANHSKLKTLTNAMEHRWMMFAYLRGRGN